MKKFKKILAATVTMLGILSVMPSSANAAWKQNSTGWWYTEGSSWATGWRFIDGQWYLFDANGYMKTGWQNINGKWYYMWSDGSMATNCYIGDYYVNNDGVWIESSTNKTAISNTVYVSKNGIYHYAANAHGMKNSVAMSLEEAENNGYKPCEAKHCP